MKLFHTALLILILLFSFGIIGSGSAVASSEGTGAGAAYGPIYDWLAEGGQEPFIRNNKTYYTYQTVEFSQIVSEPGDTITLSYDNVDYEYTYTVTEDDMEEIDNEEQPIVHIDMEEVGGNNRFGRYTVLVNSSEVYNIQLHNKERTVDNVVDYSSYELDRDAQSYFSGGFTNAEVATVELIYKLTESKQGFDTIRELDGGLSPSEFMSLRDLHQKRGIVNIDNINEDEINLSDYESFSELESETSEDVLTVDSDELDSGLDAELVEAIAGEDYLDSPDDEEPDIEESGWQANMDSPLYELNELGRTNRLGAFHDISYSESPHDDISKWNHHNVQEWDNQSSDEYNEIVLPEHKQVEDESRQDLTVNHRGNSWTPIQNSHITIFSNDPSVWVHQNRQMNMDTESEIDYDKIFDNSYHLIGSHGTLRAVYDYRFFDNHPDDDDLLSEPTSDGRTDWYYTDPSLSMEDFNLKISSIEGGYCSPSCDIEIDDVSYLSDNSIEIDWDSERRSIHGEQIELEVEMTLEYSIDRQNVRSIEDGCDGDMVYDDESDEWFCDGDITYRWINDGTDSRIHVETVTLNDSEIYTYTHEDSTTNTESSVQKAEFPDGSFEYYVEHSSETRQNNNIPWQKITFGEGEESTVTNKWEYFGSRHKGWDEVYGPEEDVYSSYSRPLELHAYPAHQLYNENESIQTISQERTALSTNTVSSPALVGHERCVQNYVDEERDQSFDGDKEGLEFSQRTNEVSGSYEYHEACYWHFNPASDGISRPALEYLDLPHRVVSEEESGFFDFIFNRGSLTYNEYIFEESLRELLAVDYGEEEPDGDRDIVDEFEFDQPALARGTYEQTDGVIARTQFNDADEVAIHSIVPNQEPRQLSISEEDTVEVKETRLEWSVPPVEHEGEEVDPREVDEIDQFYVDLELYTVDENGEYLEPINTSSNSDSYIILQNYGDQQGGEFTENGVKVNTSENGTTFVHVDTSDDTLIDAEFIPEHWTTSDDPVSGYSISESDHVDSEGFLFALSTYIITIYVFIMIINYFTSVFLGFKFAPFEMFFDEFTASWVRVAIVFGFLSFAVTQGNALEQMLMALVALYVVFSHWNNPKRDVSDTFR